MVGASLGLAGRYEPGLIGRQACGSGRQNLLSEDFEGESGMFSFAKGKLAKCISFLERKGGPSAARMGDS